MTLDEEIVESYVLNPPGHAGQARIGTLPSGRQRLARAIDHVQDHSKQKQEVVCLHRSIPIGHVRSKLVRHGGGKMENVFGFARLFDESAGDKVGRLGTQRHMAIKPVDKLKTRLMTQEARFSFVSLSA